MYYVAILTECTVISYWNVTSHSDDVVIKVSSYFCACSLSTQ